MIRCLFALCTRRDTERVESPTAIGHRVEPLCADHAAARQQQNAALLAEWARLGVAEKEGVAA